MEYMVQPLHFHFYSAGPGDNVRVIHLQRTHATRCLKSKDHVADFYKWPFLAIHLLSHSVYRKNEFLFKAVLHLQYIVHNIEQYIVDNCQQLCTSIVHYSIVRNYLQY